MLIAVNSNLVPSGTRKVYCPECRGRICDLLLPDKSDCCHEFKIVTDSSIKSIFAIKCRKCGHVSGLGFKNN